MRSHTATALFGDLQMRSVCFKPFHYPSLFCVFVHFTSLAALKFQDIPRKFTWNQTQRSAPGSLPQFRKVTENFPRSSVGKGSACNVRDLGSIPGLGRSPGEGSGSLLQNSCLENPMDRGTWQATVHGFPRVGHDLATNRKPDELGVVLKMVLVQARGTKTLPLQFMNTYWTESVLRHGPLGGDRIRKS